MRDISKMDYFQNLMSVLVDNTRRLFRLHGKEYELMPEAHTINAEMTKAGNWIDHIPGGFKTIIHTEPQRFVREAIEGVLPGYRQQAIKLIEHFRNTSKAQGLDNKIVDEHFDKEYRYEDQSQ